MDSRGDGEQARVTTEQRAQLDDLGYFITESLFDEATLTGVRNAFMRAWDALKLRAKTEGREQTGIVNASTRPFLPRISATQPTCAELCSHPALLEMVHSLLGPDVDMSWDQGIIKPPGTSGNAFGWHQDAWYAEHGDHLKKANLELARRNETAVTLWIAISRTTIENGTLWVLPGRHKEGLLPHTWSDETNDWQGDYDTSARVAAELEPGQALVFRKYLPHASGHNTSNETRIAYQIGYTIMGVHPDAVPVLRDGRSVA